jgi:protein disulfide-isomerase A1
MMPAYESAARALVKYSIPLVKVDAIQNKELADRFGAAGWPTVKIFNRGTVSEYAGGRDKPSIVASLKLQAKPASTEMRDDFALKMGVERIVAVSVVGYFAEKSNLYVQYMKAANELRESGINLMHTRNASSTSSSSEEYETDTVIVHSAKYLLTRHDQPSRVLRDAAATSDDIVKFIRESSVPLVDHRTRGNVRNDARPLLVVYYKVDFGYHYGRDTRYVRDMVADVASDFSGTGIKFAIADVDELAGEISSLGLANSDDDVKVALLGARGQKYVMPAMAEGEVFGQQHLYKFVEDLRSGKIEALLKSEPIPESQNATSSVRIVVAKSYEDEVHNALKDAVVFFHAPWCGHCQEFSPEYEIIAEKMMNHTAADRVVFVKFDGVANDAPSVFPPIQGRDSPNS